MTIETNSKLIVKPEPVELVAASTKPVYASSNVQMLSHAYKREKLAQLALKATATHCQLLLTHGEATLHGQHGSPSDSDQRKTKRRSKKKTTADPQPKKRRRNAAEMREFWQKKLQEVAHTRTHACTHTNMEHTHVHTHADLIYAQAIATNWHACTHTNMKHTHTLIHTGGEEEKGKHPRADTHTRADTCTHKRDTMIRTHTQEKPPRKPKKVVRTHTHAYILFYTIYRHAHTRTHTHTHTRRRSSCGNQRRRRRRIRTPRR